jgi:hypothetical protein
MPTMAAAKKTRDLTPAHKAAMAEGRTESRAIKLYLSALETNKPKRGRKRTPASIATRLAKIDEQAASADPLKRLKLNQEKMDLQTELKAMSVKVDLSALEKDFIAAAASYSTRQNISYEAWRMSGVAAETLKKAGISR